MCVKPLCSCLQAISCTWDVSARFASLPKYPNGVFPYVQSATVVHIV